MTLDAINVVEIFVNGKITFLFLNATGHDTVRETMEELEMKGTWEELLAVDSQRQAPLVHPWQPCQKLYYQGVGNFQAKSLPFYNRKIDQMKQVVLMKKISMEARTQVTRVALGIQIWYQRLKDNQLVLGPLWGIHLEEANLGKLWSAENETVDEKENGKENINKVIHPWFYNVNSKVSELDPAIQNPMILSLLPKYGWCKCCDGFLLFNISRCISQREIVFANTKFK